ncbi:MAG: diacylglycerol kinase family protein [Nitrospirota bacterium]
MKSLIILISNPVAKGSSDRKVAMASYFLQSKGFSVDVLFTGKKGDAERFAGEAIKKSPAMIVAAGGDGTLNEIANGVAGSDIPVAVLPLGTTNVLAKELGIPEEVKGALETAVRGVRRKVSLGRITCAGEPAGITRYFCLMAGIGFDGESVFRMNTAFKRISGKGAYVYSGFRTLAGFAPEKLAFSIDGKEYAGYSAIIGNISKYGGNFRITPDARMSDPFFYVCLFKGKKRIDLVRYVYGIFTDRHLKYHDVEYLKARHIEIRGSAHIQTDGDYLGKTPAEVEIVPGSLALVY